jgi:hypothetical protein
MEDELIDRHSMLLFGLMCWHMCWLRHDDSSLLENVDLIQSVPHDILTMHMSLAYLHIFFIAVPCRAGPTRRDVSPFPVVCPDSDVTCKSHSQLGRPSRGNEWRRGLT